MTAPARPLMRAWTQVQAARLAALPSPAEAPRQHGPGADPDRVLLIGDGPAAGIGARSRDLALSGRLARGLARRTGRGVDVEIVAALRMPLDAIGERLAAARAERHDAVVVMLGLFAAAELLPPTRWRDAVAALLDGVLASTSAATRVVLVGIPDLEAFVGAGRLARRAALHARLLNDLTENACARRSRASFLPLAAAGPRGRLTPLYEEWGTQLADALAPHLDAQVGLDGDTARAARDRPDPEERRRRALEGLGVLDSPPDVRYDRVAAAARAAFGTRFAAITFVDGDREWPKSAVGTAVLSRPRGGSLVDETIRRAGPTVRDDLADAAAMPLPGSPYNGQVRFYAGYPLESPEGYRVGALSVFDSEPHRVTVAEAYRLRDYAHLVERELWAAAR